MSYQTSSTVRKQQKQKPPIDDFNGYYEFLNNDFPSWVCFQGILYPSVNTAFQAARTTDIQLRRKIATIQSYEQFKDLVLSIKNPEDWRQKRYKVMEQLIRDKFKRNRQISNKLISTEGRKLINRYKKSGQNQLYWGVITHQQTTGKNVQTEYKGANCLGKILQNIRQDIIKSNDTQKWVLDQGLQTDGELFPQLSITVLKDNVPIEKLSLQNKNFFLFGSNPKVNFKLEHPSISKFHAAIYFSQLEVIITDTNSTHGTFIMNSNNEKIKLQALQRTVLHDGDQIVFGLSTRLYICKISFEKVEKVLNKKQVELKLNIKQCEDVNHISDTMSKQQIKSKIGYKSYQAIHIKQIDRGFSYNDIKQLFGQLGKVKKIRMIQNKKTGKFQGEAIIAFEQTKNMNDNIKDILKRMKTQEQLTKKFSCFKIQPVDRYQIDQILQDFKDKSQVSQKVDNDYKNSRRQQHRDRSRDNNSKYYSKR